MHKKKTVILFCLFLTMLCVFAACKKHSPYGVIVVDQQGMEHVIMTDANGVTVINADGDLVEIMTDSGNKKPIKAQTENGTVHADQSGAYETHAVTFPGIVENKDTVENSDCIVTIPQNWESIGNSELILRHKSTEATVSISANIGGTLTGAIDQLESDIALLPIEDGYDTDEIEVDACTATRVQYEINNMTVINYLLMTDAGKICRISCTVETDKVAASEIDTLVQSIHFK